MNNIQEMAALTAINEMLKDTSFNICTLDRIAKMLNIKMPAEPYNVLSTLHCINYTKMPAELRDHIPKMIEECLGVAPTFQFKSMQQKVIEINPKTEPEKKSFSVRLLGIGK